MATDPDGRAHQAKVLSSASIVLPIERWLDDRTLQISGNSADLLDLVHDAALHLHGDSNDPPDVGRWEIPERAVVRLSETITKEAQSSARSIRLACACSPVILAAHVVTRTPLGTALPALSLRVATTRGTNALLTRSIVHAALFVTAGHEDVLAIGTQQRPDLFALDIRRPTPLPHEMVGVRERMDAEGEVICPINFDRLASYAKRAIDAGCTSAGVAFINAYRNPAHEYQVRDVLRGCGFDLVATSSELSPMIGYLARCETTAVEAAVGPIMRAYVDEIMQATGGQPLNIMTSSGGLTSHKRFHAVDGLLSGPAGGVTGAHAIGKELGLGHVIGFDMGGTSTDVCRIDEEVEYQFEHTVGDATLMRPALAIETVAAGGGSICGYADGRLFVGPESAGAEPGPACYGRGGPLTVTDVNLLSGRIVPTEFAIPIDVDAAKARAADLLSEVQSHADGNADLNALLDGWLAIANQRMASAIERISLRRGFEVSDAAIVAFGGAGGQHACAIANLLGVSRVICPANASLLSAVGLQRSRPERFADRQVLQYLNELDAALPNLLRDAADEARQALIDEGVPASQIIIERQLAEVRLAGQESCLTINCDDPSELGERFLAAYEKRYGYSPPEARAVEVVSLRVMATTVRETHEAVARPKTVTSLIGNRRQQVRFSSEWTETPLIDRSEGRSGSMIDGPALITEQNSLIVVEPGWRAIWWGSHIVMERADEEPTGSTARSTADVAEIELFTHRLTSIAQEMGEVLQRTAMSTNIKERRDFSCGILDEHGELIVNAPHIPVHLGSLGICVRAVRDQIDMVPGDVIVTNHPGFGGSHLPDITIITPIHAIGTGELIAYAANRAHHAEIGGARPGSMPPNATRLIEEGVVIPPTHLVKAGVPRFDEIEQYLRRGPFPSRAVEENLADLRAQIAANHRALVAVQEMCSDRGLSAMRSLMREIGLRAERIARDVLPQVIDSERFAVEQLDDGTPIEIAVEPLNGGKSSHILRLDFTGTAGQHSGNLNATRAITTSAVLYLLRILIGERLPLAEGILRPVEIVIPTGLLSPEFCEDPAECPAVVGGNVETSQRVVDTLIKALGIAACSQGTMNNVLFGNDNFGYYETVCGGAGAGPAFDGASAVHTHMTNTRITDVEVMEHRYPVRVHRFAVRRGSGGAGQHRGGDGIVRELEFLEPVSLSLLSQHRRVQPFGVAGGKPGARGEQWIIQLDGGRVDLQGIDSWECQPGDRFILLTPGGGGYGPPNG